MSAISAVEKQCKECNKLLPTTEFYVGTQRGKNGQVWKYYDQLCKACRQAYQSNRRREIKTIAVRYLGGKCTDCGVIDAPCVYDFHHKDPSQKDFAIAKETKSFEVIKPELDKCILLCSNCHRKRHYL